MTLSEIRFRLEYAVPDTTDIEESSDERFFFTGTPHHSPLLEVLRSALAVDGRWKLVRVSSQPDVDGGQHVRVWVTSHLPREEAQMEVRSGVDRLVTDLIPGASLLRIEAET